jgi:tRNA dimethylallyltransferase
MFAYWFRRSYSRHPNCIKSIIMADPNKIRPVLILGPTAGGKSELAVELAVRLAQSNDSKATSARIISADSMQIYRHMDAGTAKPSPQLLQAAPHHLIDIVEPTDRFTVADWIEQAEQLIAPSPPDGAISIVVGGTNLYIKTLLEGLFDGPAPNIELRKELAQLSGGQLHQRLESIDPQAAERIHPNDLKKMVRAIEVFHATGKPISQWQTQWQPNQPRDGAGSENQTYRHNPIIIGLYWPTDAINQRINERVKHMFYPEACGLTCESLPDEVQRLKSLGVLGSQASEALGYKQVLEALNGEMSMEEAFERTKILTRRFAKNQRTWLKRFRGVHWLEPATCKGNLLIENAEKYIYQQP